MNRWLAVIFDLDDTLYPERDYVLSGFRAVADWAEGHLGINAYRGYEQLEHLFEHGVRNDTFDRWLLPHDLVSESLVSHLVNIYRSHQPTLSPFPDVRTVLGGLRDNYRLGLLSDGYLSVQRAKLDALNVRHLFDAIVFSDQWGRQAWKPSIKPFQAVSRKLATEPAKSVYVGDNPTKDFLGARRLGMYTVRVRRTGGEYVHRKPLSHEHAPACTIESLAELPRVLGKNST